MTIMLVSTYLKSNKKTQIIVQCHKTFYSNINYSCLKLD